jgi:hypothetical protein
MKQKYYYDQKFFEKDTEESFYWAGFIAADGNISQKGDFTLSLKSSDLHHIEKFKTAILSNANIVLLPPKEKTINGITTKTSGSAIIRFRAKYWINSLQRFGIVPNKTATYSIPEEIISNINFKHFIRGYFDGDGWFSIKNRRQKQRLCWGLCGNQSVLQNIQKFLQKQCQIESLPSIYSQKNIFKFEFQNQYDVHRISDYLYSNSTIFLDRKYELAKLSNQFNENTIILNLTKEQLIESYSRLKSYQLMAKEFGCAKSTIAKYMKKLHLTGAI